jgi:hypothetical protein
MIQRRKPAVGIIVASLLLAVLSGGASGNSKFDLAFLGERLDACDGRALALGGDLQFIPDSLGVLQKNPAVLMFCNKVTIGAAQLASMNRGASSDYSETNVTVTYPALMLAVPLSEHIVCGIGYRGRYNPDASMAIQVEEEGFPIHRQVFSRTGGLFSIPFTVAMSPSRRVIAGAYLSMERGSIEDRWEIRFKDTAYIPSFGYKKVEFSGTGFGFGVVLFPTGPVMLGANYESAISYDTDVYERYTQTALDSAYAGTVEMPSELGVSLTWRVSSAWNLCGGAAWRDFGSFEGLDFPSERLHRQERYAVGAEFGERRKLPLRFSFAYERMPYDFPESKRINKITAGIGTGLLLNRGKGKIDITVQVGQTGAIDTNGLQDKFYRLFIGVGGGETWKRRGVARW